MPAPSSRPLFIILVLILAAGAILWAGAHVNEIGASTPSPLTPSSSTSAPAASAPSTTPDRTAFSYATTTVIAPNGALQAQIADTDASREQGLSDVPSMATSSGMLFAFDEPGSYGFWMKDMDFPLTMVWIGSDKQVVGLARDLSPDTYPEVFFPPAPVEYVLEIDAGAEQSLGIATGTPLRF